MTSVEEHLFDMLDTLEKTSEEMYIPSISREDGTLLAALSFAACTSSALQGELLLVDAGAGIGYSTVWLALGAIRSRGKCRILAIEYDSRLYKHLRSTARRLNSFISAEAIHDNALNVIDQLDNIALLFVDVEKHQYRDMLLKAIAHITPGGFIAFHNALFPRPPEEFFQAVDELGWPSITVPTLAGGMLLIRRPST